MSPKRIIRRGRLASRCDADLAYGHPGALHSIGIRNGFAIRYAKNGARKGSSAAVASLRTAAQTWRTDIRVPCTPSTCAMGLTYSRP
jgi:hypothetical protein